MTKTNLVYLIMISLLLLTNNRIPFHDSLVMIAASDTYSYLAIAKSCPELPSEKMSFHHAQRFVLPYVIGYIHRITGVSIESLFYYSVLISVLLLVFVIHNILDQLKVDGINKFFSISLIIFNPYFFRFYLTFPGYGNDLAFNLGLSIVFLSLINSKIYILFIGILLCSITRQTAIMIIIPTAVWILKFWRHKNLIKFVVISSFSLIIISCYLTTGMIASLFAFQNRNLEHITGIFFWLLNDFNLTVLIKFICRGIIPFTMPLALYIGIIITDKDRKNHFKQSKILWMFICFFIFLIVQPIMAGPEITGGNIQRLCLPALLPLIIILSVISNKGMVKLNLNHNFQLLMLIELLIFSGSFHHLYSFYQPAPNQTLYFGLFYMFASCLIFLTMIYITRFSFDINSS